MNLLDAIVQKDPPKEGGDGWLRTIIVLVVTGAITFLCSILQRWRTGRQKRAALLAQLTQEVKFDLQMLAGLRPIFEKAISAAHALSDDGLSTAWAHVIPVANAIRSDRFHYFFEKEKPSVYMLKASSELTGFHRHISLMKMAVRDGSPAADRESKWAIASGQAFLRAHGVEYPIDVALWRQVYETVTDPSNKELIDGLSDPPEP